MTSSESSFTSPEVQSFIFESLPGRTRFGSGTLALLASEVAALGGKRALVVCTGGSSDTAVRRAVELLGPLHRATFAEAVMHTPVQVTRTALEVAAMVDADCIVSIGGGSAIGLGKAIALLTDLPQVVVPTTYAGSEMTPLLGQTENGVKTTQRTLKVLPETVIYDVDLTLSLPPVTSVVSGMNAMAHAIEALYAENTNPVIALMAEAGISALYKGLQQVFLNPASNDGRWQVLYGAWLSAVCLGTTQMGLHHKLCHEIGGTFNLPHAQTHAIMLPHSLAFNAPAVAPAQAVIRRALGEDDTAGLLFDLLADSTAPCGLRDLGMPESGIETIVDAVLAKPYANPRELERDPLRRVIANAWVGARPETGDGKR